MPDPASPAQAVLEELGFVLFARAEPGTLRLLGQTPAWLGSLWPALAREDRILVVAEASPFLENFLVDAEECWRQGGAKRARSGPWVEPDSSGAEVQLEATALTVDAQAILLLERLGEAFEAKRSVLQRARETVIAHQRLNSEIQKKEILLHCVADEMTTALANIITSLRLIELQENGARTKLLLGLAHRAAQEQQTLIHRILAVFEEELRGVYTSGGSSQAAADWNAILRRALESASALYTEKGVSLEAPATLTKSRRLAVDPAHLERVLMNLFENALERSSPGGTVLVRAEEEAENLLFSVEDGGPLLGPQASVNLFAQWDRADSAPASALRLHFCRIVVENSGGEIGYTALPAGRSRFWVRLTNPDAPE